MTTTPPPSSAESPAASPAGSDSDGGPRVSRDEVRDLSRLRRTTGDRKVAGVAGGLARHLDIDPVILRVGFVVLAFFGGAGLILYAAGWALVPEEDRERAPVHLDERSRTVALVSLGVIAALALVGDSWGTNWFPWPLAIIGLIVFVWLSRTRDGREQRQQRAETEPTGETGDAQGPYAQTPYAQSSYAQTPYAQSSYAEPTRYAPPRPRDPRKRGPKLFWFTLLLIGVSEGVLGIVDAAGAPIVDSAYAALATGVIALMLIVGAFVGRAGGLIVLGLISFLVLAAATAADRWDGERYEYHPTSAEEVSDSYTMSSGELVLDLTDVTDIDALDGRTIELNGDAGQFQVVVPDGVDVDVTAEIGGPGGYEIFDREGGGFSSRVVDSYDGGPDAPTLTLDARLSVGEIQIITED